MFSKIDLSNAYQQMGLSAESLHFLTVETHKGLHTNQRLTYGFASAPTLFGSTVDHKLQGTDKVRRRIEDIPIRTEAHEHLKLLDKVLTWPEQHVIVAKWSMCEFMASSFAFLGYCVGSEGGHPTEETIAAINEAPSAKNVTKLRSYIKFLNEVGGLTPVPAIVLFL